PRGPNASSTSAAPPTSPLCSRLCGRAGRCPSRMTPTTSRPIRPRRLSGQRKTAPGRSRRAVRCDGRPLAAVPARLVGGFGDLALGRADLLFGHAGCLLAEVAGHLADRFLRGALDFLAGAVEAVLVHDCLHGWRTALRVPIWPTPCPGDRCRPRAPWVE